jgi:hypothetical protein
MLMTTYRVGRQGATVFSEDGTALCWLPPGRVVVEGSTELSGTPAAEAHDKRLGGYADKAMHAERDYQDKGR